MQLKHLLLVPQSLIEVVVGLILDVRVILAVTHSPQMMELTSRSQCQVALSSPPDPAGTGLLQVHARRALT